MKKDAIGIIAILLVLLHLTVAGQHRFRFERYFSNNGLSMAGIRCIAQDSSNFLWIGTRDGLNRYDGNRFTIFNRDLTDSTALMFNQVLSLNVDKKGNVWIGSVGGIAVLQKHTGKFKNFPFSDEFKDLSVNSIFHKSEQTILLATDQGVVSFNRLSEKVEYDPIYKVFKPENINDIHIDGEIGMLIASSNGLYRMHDGGPDWQKIIKADVLDLNVEQHHVMVATSSGLFQYEFASGHISEVKLPDGIEEVMETKRTRNGDLWVACGKVVVLDKNNEVKALLEYEQSNIFSLSENRARTIFETKDGVIWVGTRSGLNKYNPDINNFSYLGSKSVPSLSTNYVTTIYTNTDTILYVGTSQGLNIVDLKKNKTRFLLRERPVEIYKIKHDSRSRIWASTDVGFYQIINGRSIVKNAAATTITDFIELDERRLILAARKTGLFLFDTETSALDTIRSDKGYPREIATLKLRDGQIWVGGNDGLRIYSLQGHLRKHFQNNPLDSTSLPINSVRCLFNDHRNTIWIGTWGGGLSKFNSQDSTFTTINISDGLPSNVIYGILEDQLGTLWISTNVGIAAYDPHRKDMWRFDVQDGLQGNSFNTGANFQSLYGTMYFGGPEGLTFFNPEKILSKRNPAQVSIIQIINGKEVINATDAIEIPWSQNSLTIEFTTIDFKAQGQYEFQYSLNDEPWINTANRRYLELINLNSGKYEIKIRARKQGNGWSPPAELIVIVSRAFWKNPWVISFGVLLLLAALYFIYLLRINQLKKRNELLSRVVKERTREIQIKNEEIVAQNDELMSQTEQVNEKNLLLEQSRMELELLSSELEKKVNERVKDINSLNENLIEQNLQLEQFSFIAAHNFNGPIARIKGLIEIMGRGNKADLDFESFLSMLETSVKELDQVTQDLNKILHIKRTAREYFERVKLLPILVQTLESFQHKLKSTPVDIDISEFKDLSILGSRPLVQSIFHNLIDNAIKYSRPSANSYLRLSCYVEGKTTKILFSDNGIGIDLKMAITKIFRLYQRFTLGMPGKGLGLYMVKTQVEMMNGVISVTSTLGIGTTFTLEFPCIEDTSDEIKISISTKN